MKKCANTHQDAIGYVIAIEQILTAKNHAEEAITIIFLTFFFERKLR
jgi:hypothetical protein